MQMITDSNRTEEFRIGDRVELSPHTDDWIRGDRYGEIVNIETFTVVGSTHMAISVCLDKSNRTKVHPRGNLRRNKDN